jgi:hypothetical protein
MAGEAWRVRVFDCVFSARAELDRPAGAGSMMVPVMVLRARHLQ